MAEPATHHGPWCDEGEPEEACPVCRPFPAIDRLIAPLHLGRVAEFFVTVDDGDDSEATLAVQITDEGVIADVVLDGEVIATWGATAQELAENYCH